MTTIVIAILVAALCGWAVWRIVVKVRKGGGCCGEHEATVRKSQVTDKNRKHYPFRCILEIGGMTCDNCARRVENALIALPGVWATVDISTQKATVYLKEKPVAEQLRNAVASAGYTVLSIHGA